MSETTDPPTDDTPVTEGGGNISIVLSHGSMQVSVSVPEGTDLGHVRTLSGEMDELGTPSSYMLAVNNVGQDDSRVLVDRDIISFRPVAGNKG